MKPTLKKLLLPLLMACSLATISAPTRASQPPPAMSLAQRVDLASLVVLGTPKKVWAVELKDGKFQKIKPEPKVIQGYGEWVELEIEVEEVLFPANWKRKKTIRYLFGGGWFEVESIRTGMIGHKGIFLLRSLKNEYEDDSSYKSEKNLDEVFLPSYPWNMAEQLDKRPEIVASLADANKLESEGTAIRGTGVAGTLMMVGFPKPNPDISNDSIITPSTEDRPLENTEIVVRRRSDKSEVARLKTDVRGRFRIDLVSGEYSVEPLLPFLNPTGKNKFYAVPASVTVWRGTYAKAQVQYDGGF